MPRTDNTTDPDSDTAPTVAADTRFLRSGHIFASAIRETLELELLRGVTNKRLTCSQLYLLKLIAEQGRHQVGELANLLGVTPPAATKNIDKLERLGLVVRHRSTGDRRATLLSASPQGCDLIQKYEASKAARLSSALSRFQPEEVSQATELLERFAVALLDLDSSGQGCRLRCAAYIADDCPVGRTQGGCPHARGACGDDALMAYPRGETEVLEAPERRTDDTDALNVVSVDRWRRKVTCSNRYQNGPTCPRKRAEGAQRFESLNSRGTRVSGTGR